MSVLNLLDEDNIKLNRPRKDIGYDVLEVIKDMTREVETRWQKVRGDKPRFVSTLGMERERKAFKTVIEKELKQLFEEIIDSKETPQGGRFWEKLISLLGDCLIYDEFRSPSKFWCNLAWREYISFLHSSPHHITGRGFIDTHQCDIKKGCLIIPENFLIDWFIAKKEED